MRKQRLFFLWIGLLSLILVAADALAREAFILATGRRDPRIYAIDLAAALDPRNNNTPNAIVSRSKVHPDRLDGTPLGDPANIVLSEDNRMAYVVNHHGAVSNAEFLQHGGRGSVSVMDVRRMLDREFDNTDRALRQNFDSGYFGAVGLLVLPEVLLVSHSESWLSEDGSNRISIIDRRNGSRRGQIEMALGHPPHDCPHFPVCLRLRLRSFPSRLRTRCLAAGPIRSFLHSAPAAMERLTCFREMRARMTCQSWTSNGR